MEFLDFLAQAKRETYASENARATKLDDGTKQLVFEKGIWRYVDRYKGFDPFFGTEVVKKNWKDVWVMNYFGGITARDANAEVVYAFLREALRNVPNDIPLRGPLTFEGEDMVYFNYPEGDIDRFSGKDLILSHKDAKVGAVGRVYEGHYHGGTLPKKS